VVASIFISFLYLGVDISALSITYTQADDAERNRLNNSIPSFSPEGYFVKLTFPKCYIYFIAG
jgi:hypothetical protein